MKTPATTAWQSLTDALAAKRLSHAVLLTGSLEAGRREFARRFAELLLCEAPAKNAAGGPQACGQCRSCIQFKADAHPNLFWLVPAEDKRDIAIESLRTAMERLTLSAYYGGRKLLVLDPVDALNSSGLNALLKTLEEPPASTHLLLLTQRAMNLPATVRSRCQLVRLPAASVQSGVSDADVGSLIQALSQGRIQEPLNQLKDLDREQLRLLYAGLLACGVTALNEKLSGLRSDAFAWVSARELGAWLQTTQMAIRALSGPNNPQMLTESNMIKIWQLRAGRSKA